MAKLLGVAAAQRSLFGVQTRQKYLIWPKDGAKSRPTLQVQNQKYS